MKRAPRHPVEQRVGEALALLPDGVRLLAAVSGGADSVAMLRALTALGVKPLVVTCDFGLRGEESRADTLWVSRLCHDLGLECIIAPLPAAQYAEEKGVSVEMACRDLRYNLFFRLMEQRGLSRVAVAHNADDNIETLLLNLLRTTGIRGLCGMGEDNGRVWRPLLTTSRSEIIGYLEALGQDHREDHTNAETDYRRNFLRNKVLPLLEERWPQARRAIAATQRNLRSEAAVLEECLKRDNPVLLTLADMAAGGATAIHRFARSYGASGAQADEMVRLSGAYAKGRRWPVREGCIYSDTEGLRYVAWGEEQPTAYVCTRIEATPETLQAMRRNPRRDVAYLPRPLDCYVWRQPRRGDRIRPLGMKGSRLVSDVLKESGLDYGKRLMVRVLVRPADDEIVWVEGLCRSRHDLVEADARCFYRIAPEEKREN